MRRRIGGAPRRLLTRMRPPSIARSAEPVRRVTAYRAPGPPLVTTQHRGREQEIDALTTEQLTWISAATSGPARLASRGPRSTIVTRPPKRRYACASSESRHSHRPARSRCAGRRSSSSASKIRDIGPASARPNAGGRAPWVPASMQIRVGLHRAVRRPRSAEPPACRRSARWPSPMTRLAPLNLELRRAPATRPSTISRLRCGRGPLVMQWRCRTAAPGARPSRPQISFLLGRQPALGRTRRSAVLNHGNSPAGSRKMPGQMCRLHRCLEDECAKPVGMRHGNVPSDIGVPCGPSTRGRWANLGDPTMGGSYGSHAELCRSGPGKRLAAPPPNHQRTFQGTAPPRRLSAPQAAPWPGPGQSPGLASRARPARPPRARQTRTLRQWI